MSHGRRVIAILLVVFSFAIGYLAAGCAGTGIASLAYRVFG